MFHTVEPCCLMFLTIAIEPIHSGGIQFKSALN